MQFLVLGPLEVVAQGRPVVLRAAKQRALLAALLVQAGRAVPADRLIDALWEGRPPASAVKTLQTYVSQLRRELEPDARPGAWGTLRTADGGYQLRVDPDRLDAARFERLVDDGRRALDGARLASAAAWLREGEALWRGPAYGEFAAAPFARGEATRLEELRLVALEWRVEAELGLGGHAELVDELEELVGREPFRERLWAQLMLALYRSGRQADALGAYRRLRDHLAGQLGVDPVPELRQLEERILRQDPSLALAGHVQQAGGDLSRLPPVLAALPPGRLAGRGHELDLLQQEWERARAGARRVVVVSGEPGIGKTQLAAELARTVLGDGGDVLVGHADEEPLVPYQPFVEAVGQHRGLAAAAARLPAPVWARLAPLLPAAGPVAAGPPASGPGPVPAPGAPPSPPDQDLDRFRLLEAMAALLAELAGTAPLLLVLEDLQWADQATVAMLLHLAGTPAGAPLLLLVTCSADGRATPPALAHALAELRRQRLAELVTLGALDDDAVAGLAAAELGGRPAAPFAAALRAATDGNPFHAEELLRHLRETGAIDPVAGRWPEPSALAGPGVPGGVRAVLAQRLARLSAPTAELLQAAAVLGREFELTLLARVAGWDDEPVVEGVEEALRAGILSERGASWAASYSFRHALGREALDADLSVPRRQRLHLRAAEAIRTEGPDDPAGVAAAALHLRLAGPLADQATLAELSTRAGDAAAAVYAWDDAVAHLRAALAALERAGAPPGERARLAERLGVLVYQAGTGLREGIGHLEQALAGYLPAGEEGAAARVHSRLGMYLTTYPDTLDVPAAAEHYRAAEAILARGPEQRPLGYLYVGMAMAAVFGVRTDRIETASRRALEVAERLGDERLASWAGYQRAWWAFDRGRLAESLSLHEAVRDAAAAIEDVRMGAWVAFERAVLSGSYLADPRTAEAWCAAALELPHLRAFPRQRDNLLDQLGQALGDAGALADARRIAGGLDPGSVLERMLWYWSGEWERAEAAWVTARERDLAAGDRLDATLGAYWLGRLRRRLGDADAAASVLAEGLAVALDGPHVPAEVLLRAELALLGAQAGRPEAARPHLARCTEILQAGEDWRGCAGRVQLAAAVLAAAEGGGVADATFAAAAATFGAYDLAWEEAEAHQLWAGALDAAGRPADAHAHRQVAAGIHQRLGAPERWATG
ncbi:MAG TPA: BTAD domain-containing putative transcriptional regulator [Actinomycetes bacterium]|nr:BTAD domain-containing putative transcriptional regulator [Actinomycetes bacterium]